MSVGYANERKVKESNWKTASSSSFETSDTKIAILISLFCPWLSLDTEKKVFAAYCPKGKKLALTLTILRGSDVTKEENVLCWKSLGN
jgi:hypothetical protein